MINRAIFTPTNDYMDQINNLLMHQSPRDIMRYFSFDELVVKSDKNIHEDFLHTFTPNGMSYYGSQK